MQWVADIKGMAQSIPPLDASPEEPLPKEIWIRRFATAAFMANNQVPWEKATALAQRLWKDFKLIEPEKVAKTYSDGARS